MSKLAIFPLGIDSLFLDYSAVSVEPYYVVEANSAAAKWCRTFLPAESIISYHLNAEVDPSYSVYEKALLGSDLINLLQVLGVKKLLITSRCTPRLYDVMQQYHLEWIGPAYEFQTKYENKLWFDDFLLRHGLPKPPSVVYRYPDKPPFLDQGGLVLQAGVSRGGEGTYFIKREEELEKLVQSGHIQAETPYLARRLMSGRAYGIELLITQSTLAMTCLRAQSFYPKSVNGQRIFSGSQWYPTQKWPEGFRLLVSDTLIRLARLMREDGYRGYANVDLMVDQDSSIALLECNARFSGGSPLIVSHPEVFGGLDSGALFLADIFGGGVPESEAVQCFEFPESSFAGAQFLHTNLDSGITSPVSKSYPMGVYRFENGAVQYVTPDIGTFPTEGDYFIYVSNVQVGDRLRQFDEYGVFYANFPLYDANGGFLPVIERLMELFNPFANS